MALTIPAPTELPADLHAEASAPVALAPVACAPWCVDGQGHTDAHFPEDQVCRGETVDVELTRLPLVEVDEDAWRRDSMHLYLLRHAGALMTTVEMYRGDLGESTSLTLDEAEALGRALLASVRDARG